MGSSPSGRYSAGGINCHAAPRVSITASAMQLIRRRPVWVSQPTSGRMNERRASSAKLVPSPRRALAAGTTQTANTVVMLDASTAGQTSRTPATADSKRSNPRRLACSMLSSTTMVLSSVMPIAKATPASDITLMVRPNSSKQRKPAMVQMGMPIKPMRVARDDRRKKYNTMVASAAPSNRLVKTLRTESCTYLTSSPSNTMRRPLRCSKSDSIWATAASIACLIWITLEPASRLTASVIARSAST